jgi:hypothetical protein
MEMTEYTLNPSTDKHQEQRSFDGFAPRIVPNTKNPMETHRVQLQILHAE